MIHTTYVTGDPSGLEVWCSCGTVLREVSLKPMTLDEIQQLAQDHVQCTAMSGGDNPVRCELDPGHPPYVRGEYRSHYSYSTVYRDDKPWDHAAPSEGTYWMER